MNIVDEYRQRWSLQCSSSFVVFSFFCMYDERVCGAQNSYTVARVKRCYVACSKHCSPFVFYVSFSFWFLFWWSLRHRSRSFRRCDVRYSLKNAVEFQIHKNSNPPAQSEPKHIMLCYIKYDSKNMKQKIDDKEPQHKISSWNKTSFFIWTLITSNTF